MAIKKSTKPITKASAQKTVKPPKPTESVKPKPVKSAKAVATTKAVRTTKPVKPVKTVAVAKSTTELVSQKHAQKEIDLLCQKYPDADCELDYKSAFQLLTAVILSAQTTDVNVNKVTKNLFAKYPDAKSLAEADLNDIKNLVKSTGYYNAKATNIQNCAQALVARFGGEVPNNIEELVTLPGVGRKTANVVLGVIFGVPGWTVDTHVQRLSHRLGLTENTDPVKIETDLQKLFPDQDWSKISITLIWHGRRQCFARNPDCPNCPINHLCPAAEL